MPMRNMLRPVPTSLFIVALLFTGCGSSTHVVQSWHDPAVQVTDGAYNKVLVIGLVKDESTRRIAEDRMASFMNGHGKASYTYLGPDVEAINDAGMNERMRKDGIDGVIIMRLMDQTKEQTYVAGSTYPSYYSNPWGYYGHSYGYYSTPGYVRTDVRYTVETNLYSTKRDGLMWTSTTSTVNPTDLGTTVDEIMQAVYDRMKRDGFVVAAPVAK